MPLRLKEELLQLNEVQEVKQFSRIAARCFSIDEHQPEVGSSWSGTVTYKKARERNNLWTPMVVAEDRHL